MIRSRLDETPRRRATRYQHGNKLFTRRKRRGIHPEYPSPVPFPTRREGVQGLGTLKLHQALLLSLEQNNFHFTLQYYLN
jgi:hypothetical protein